MKLVVLYCKLSDYTDEKISVSCISILENSIAMTISKEKLSYVQKILPGEVFKFIKSELSYYHEICRQMNNSMDNSIDFDNSTNNTFLDVYKRSNNLLLFSAPIYFPNISSKEEIEKIIQYYLFYKHKNAVNDKTNFNKVVTQFKKDARERLNYDVEIQNILDKSRNIKVPITIGFAGRNGSLIAGDFLNSNIGTGALLYKMNTLIQISESIIEDKPSSDYYVITDIQDNEETAEYYDILESTSTIKTISAEPSTLKIFANDLEKKDCRPILEN